MKNKYISKVMRNKFSKSTAKIKSVLFLFLGLAISANLNAQNSYTINTVGNSFSPSSLTIDVGDTVIWNNIAGSHNINANQATFPNNPEGFGNGVAPAPWSFQWVFTMAGTYDYQCDPHASGMSGMITVNNSGCPPSFSYTTVDATDAFTTDGEITVTVDPLAVGPFDYYLFDISGSIIQGPFMSQASNVYTFLNLSSGYYELAVNNQDCPSSGFNSIDSINIYSIAGGTITYSGFMGYCGSAGANITAYSNGCASPTTIGNQFILTDISGTLVDSSVLMTDSISYSSLMANQYILQITNLDNNCTSIDTFSITANSLQSTYTYTNPSSSVAIDGSITITSNGTAPFSISIDNGSSWDPTWTNGDPIPVLGQGTYICLILDALGCMSTDTIELIYNACSATLDTIGTCYPLMLSAQTTNVISGVYAYTYNLSLAGTVIETINSALDSIIFNTIVSGPGQYLLEVINDSTGCISFDLINIVMNPITVNATVNNIMNPPPPCTGSIFVSPITGVFPYTFTWDTAGVVFSTSQGLNTSQILLCENTYCLTIVDGNGCTYNDCYDVAFIPCDVSVTIFDSIPCYGGVGILQANIDTNNLPLGPVIFTGPRYTFELFTTNPLTPVGAPQLTNNLSFIFPNLPSNNYLVSVFDASYGTFCSSDSLFLSQPDPIVIYTSVDSSSAPWMQDGVITIDSITGGTPGYNITWLDSVGIPLPTFGNLVQDSLGYSNQYNGGYTINVTDTNGCFETVTVYVHPQNAGDSLHFDTISIIHPTCFGSCDGKLWAHVYGIGPYAVPPFIFEWYDLVTGALLKTDSLGSPWYNPSHIATYTNRCAGVYRVQAYDYYGNAFPDTEFPELIDPDSIYVQLGPDFVIPCGEDTVLTSVVVGGNTLNDTALINTQTLSFGNAPIGFADTLTSGLNYLMVVSGTYQDGAGNTYDAAYDYTTLPATAAMDWVMDGNTTHRPTPNVYQTNHVYEFAFVGNGIHQFYMLNSALTGSLTFQLYEIHLDTSIYTYSWTTSPPSFPVAVISTADTAVAYPGVNGTDYIITVQDVLGCEAVDTVAVSWDLYILNFDTVSVVDVLCNGDSSGSITITPDLSTGFSPYTPFINGAATTSTTYNLPSGSYVVHLEDTVGCLSQDSIVTINHPDSLYACGIDTAMVSVLVDAFTMTFDTAFSHTTVSTQLGIEYKLVVSGTYTDTWTSSTPVDIKDAAYQFNVTPQLAINDWGWNGTFITRPTPDVYNQAHTYEYDFTGDGATQVFTYTSPTANYAPNGGTLNFELYKMICSFTDTAYTCFGDSTGTATVYPNGGTPFINSVGNPYYNVVWKSNSGVIWGTNATVTGLPAGSFTATISDSLGCTYERGLVVLQPTAPFQIDSLTQTDVMCKGDSTGVIYAVISGGWGSNISVLMLGSDTVYSAAGQLDTIQITGLPAGVYDFNVYDTIPDGLYGIYGCGQNVQITITEPQDYLSSTINLLTPGGVSCWGDSTGAAIANVIGGQFPYSYLWDNGETNNIATGLWAGWQGVTFTDANGCTLRDSIEILHLYPEISGIVTVLQDNSCFNSCDAIATLSTVGGVLPHTYFWDVGQTSVNMPDTAFNLCAGGHDILVEDALGCRRTISFIVSQPDELFAQAIMTQPVQCYGFDDGTAFGSATGGTPTYTFVWDSINGQAGQNAVALTPGVHTIYVTDSKGCTASDTVVITEPNQLEVEIVDSMTVYSYCAGTNSGQLCAIASGGIPNYNYVWTGGQNTSCAYNLIAGTYTVIVMDDRNCIATTTFDLDSITNSMTPSGVSMTVVDASCFGDYNGSVTINTVAGAVAPFTYNWTPSVGTTNSIGSLYAGSYAVVIEDSNGCAITVNAEVGEPDQLEYTTYNVFEASCFGACNGQIWVNVQGGTGNYYYDDSEVGNFTIPFPNPIQLVNDSLIFDLCAGLHSIYITDDNNCEGAVVWGGTWQEFVDSGVVVTPPSVVVSTNASCVNSNDGAAFIPWPGGNPLFTYTWETDPLTSTVDTGVSTSILYPGNYVLVAHYSDSTSFGQVYSGCDASSAVFTIVGPSSITSGAVITDVSCYGDVNGAIDLTPIGGIGAYSYLWDITTSIPVGNLTNEDHTNLQPGTYTVTITDGNGCELTEDLTVGEPDAITSYFNPIIAVSCNGLFDGSATANPTGGVGSYSYVWSPSGGNAAIANGLGVNTYAVQITDANNCVYIDSIAILEPASVISSVEADPLYFGPYDVKCYGESNASATAYGSAVSFSWEDAAANVVATTQSTGAILSEGTYTVTAADINGCTAQSSILITEPNELLANIIWSTYSTAPYEVSCLGANDGWAESNPTGGVGGINALDYNFVWNDNLNNIESYTPFADDLTANKSYTVTVTDANGCQAFGTTPVFTEPAAFVADVQTTNYAGPTHAPFTVNFVDNTVCIDPYNFNWTWEDGATPYPSGTILMEHEFTVNNVGVNNVYVILTNEVTGCTDSVSFIIDAQGIPNSEIFNAFSPNNDGINDDFTFGEFGMENVEVVIYNRWGQEVYSWTGENKEWDGRGADGQNLPEAVYFFVFKADGLDGHYYEEKGSVTIMR